MLIWGDWGLKLSLVSPRFKGIGTAEGGKEGFHTCERESASARVRSPVRPEAPRSRMRVMVNIGLLYKTEFQTILRQVRNCMRDGNIKIVQRLSKQCFSRMYR